MRVSAGSTIVVRFISLGIRSVVAILPPLGIPAPRRLGALAMRPVLVRSVLHGRPAMPRVFLPALVRHLPEVRHAARRAPPEQDMRTTLPAPQLVLAVRSPAQQAQGVQVAAMRTAQ